MPDYLQILARVIFLIVAGCPCLLFGQDLGVTSQQITVVNVAAPDNATVTVSAFGSDLAPVSVRDIGGRRYEIGGSGIRLVIVSAMDVAAGWSQQTDIRIQSNNGPQPPPDPIDPVDPDPPLPGEYDGPNDLGLGKLSFDSAPGYSADVVRIYKAAGEFLYGRPEVKVMSVESTDPRNGTDFEIPVWIKSQMDPIARNNNDWRVWYEKVMGKTFEMNRDGAIRSTSDWYSAFQELAAGVEARK